MVTYTRHLTYVPFTPTLGRIQLLVRLTYVHKHRREEVELEFIDGPPRTLIVAALRSVD